MHQQNKINKKENSKSIRIRSQTSNEPIKKKSKLISVSLISSANQSLVTIQDKKIKLPIIEDHSKPASQKKYLAYKNQKYIDSYFKKDKNEKERFANKMTLSKKQKHFFKQWGSIQLIEQECIINEKLMQLLQNLPQIQQRNQQNMQQVCKELSSNNSFFKKLPQSIIFSLLRISKIVRHQKNDLIFKRGSPSHSFYIILDGKIYVFDQVCFYKKVLGAGQLLGQQILFQQNEKIKSLVVIQNGAFQKIQNAICSQTCCYLEIDLEAYEKMKKNLLKYGFKQELNTLQILINRNFYSKFSQRKFKLF